MIQTFCTCCAISAQQGPVFACTTCAPEGVDLVASLRGAVRDMSPEQARRFWAAIGRLGDDLLQPDYPAELVEAELREMGIDPEALAERGAAFVAGIKERR